MYNESKKAKYLLALTIIISFLIHVTFFAGLSLIPSEKRSPQNTSIEIITRTPHDQSVVTQTDLMKLHKAIEQLKKKSHFLSKKAQRVKKQSKARITGLTKNLIPSSVPQLKRSSKPQPITNKSYQSDIKVMPQKPPQNIQGSIGASSVQEHLPFIKEGAFTALNTDQIPYYAFYSRINREIGSRWVQNIRQYYDRLNSYKVYRLSKSNKTTQLEVVLDPSGNLLDIFVYKTTGSPDLDKTAIKAFEQSTPYLNPPEGLVSSEDGLIHLHYSFHIHWNPPNVANGSQY